ncbi:cytochrome ubiquinol oxidase subunit I [Caldivirga maquilingensis]|uniref:Cytochrome bd-type quinol oxidase subunit 1-like protein n=1 Tax=Caldivirga maquilingensis (strain ATCC 700844 / DSM 13496 / JCM 10307 / IC-167) TaxID=397948 RepID=A8MAD2_CALMQ|nr:cytochrome ubiquinol oxidase subunit I [Caldivirga maquilingensis]ABW02509.1 Cytochrome bd-type quinol oxidase subunit 1-like protein [Caldivirga maquilingensis IC-167]
MPSAYVLSIINASTLDAARWVSAIGILAHLSLASSFLGTILIAVIAEYLYLVKHDKDWYDKARMFSVVSTIFFGVGAAFGTLVEFGLVTIWSNFITIIGSAIVLPFYLELFAFLTEVILLPLYVFTWGKVRNGWVHWVIGLAAAFGGYWSAYNILAVMASLSMRPPGMIIQNLAASNETIAGLTSYLVTWAKPTDAWNMFWWGANVFIFHGILAAAILTWSVVGAIYLYGYVREHRPDQAKVLKVIIPGVAVMTAIEGFILGHDQGELVLQFDPLKLAAIEGMFWKGLKVDPLLSFFAYGTFNHAFWGYYSWPANVRPPLAPFDFLPIFYLGFMVTLGVLLGVWSGGLSLWYLFNGFFSRFNWARVIASFLERTGPYAMPLFAALAAIGGAVTSESGRVPFILVDSSPNPNGGPPTVTGVPIYEGGLINPNLSLPGWLVALIIIVEVAMPALAVYMVYLYTKPKEVKPTQVVEY